MLSTGDSVKHWVQHNGTETEPATEVLPDTNPKDRGHICLAIYGNVRAGTEVVLYEAVGGGHTEPSLSGHYR